MLNLLFHCYMFVCILPRKAVPEIAYTKSGGTLNPTHSLTRRILLLFTRQSSYCFQRILAITILSVHLFVCLSVCPSVTRVDQSKTVQARITKSSPSAAWKTLVSRTVKLFHQFEGVTPKDGAK